MYKSAVSKSIEIGRLRERVHLILEEHILHLEGIRLPDKKALKQEDANNKLLELMKLGSESYESRDSEHSMIRF